MARGEEPSRLRLEALHGRGDDGELHRGAACRDQRRDPGKMRSDSFVRNRVEMNSWNGSATPSNAEPLKPKFGPDRQDAWLKASPTHFRLCLPVVGPQSFGDSPARPLAHSERNTAGKGETATMIDDEPESERVSALVPFRHGIFRAVWSANLVSNFGGLIQGVGAAWMMTTIATSSYQVALVQASTTLPIMLFALIAGAIADSFNRRKVMLVAQTFMLVVSALLTVFTWFGWMTPWTLLAFTFLIDSGTAQNSPSWQASVGDIVPRAKVPAAVALNSMGFNITRSVGPAIGGIIVAAAGAAAAFAANAISYIGL